MGNTRNELKAYSRAKIVENQDSEIIFPEDHNLVNDRLIEGLLNAEDDLATDADFVTPGATDKKYINPFLFAGKTITTLLGDLSGLLVNAAIASTDTIKQAFGKLQKQITDHKADTSNPHAVTKAQIGLGNADNTADTAKPVSTAQQAALNLKLNIADYNDRYKGKFTSLSALQTAFPAPVAGWYALVDNVLVDGDVKEYIVDTKTSGTQWVLSSVTAIANTDSVSEGSTNLYFQVARVLASALTGLSTATNSVVTSGDSVLSGFGKLQAQISANVTAIVGKLGIGDVHAAASKTTPVDSDEIGLQDSASSFGLAKVTWANVKATLAGLFLSKSNNLSDIANAGSCRLNLNVPALFRAKAVSVANIASLSGVITVDGVSLIANDRVLLTTQTTASQNGPWLIQSGAWTRPTDFVSGFSVNAHIILVAGGTSYLGTLWGMTGNTAVIIDTDAQSWIKINLSKGLAETISGNWDFSGILTSTDFRVKAPGGNYARATKIDSSNVFALKNQALQQGGIGGALSFTSTSQYASGNDADLPTGNGSFTVSLWVYISGANKPFLSWGSAGAGLGVALGTGSSNGLCVRDLSGNIIITENAPVVNQNTWVNILIQKSGSTWNFYINNVLGFTSTGTTNIALSGVLSLCKVGTGFTQANTIIDQVLIYNRVLTRSSGVGGSDEIAQIYAIGAGTSSPPTSGLVRKFGLDDATGTNIDDSNPAGTQYDLTTVNSPTWTAGKAPVTGTIGNNTLIESSDGELTGERGKHSLGDPFGGTITRGLQVATKINDLYYSQVTDANGKTLISPTNTDRASLASEALEVVGNSKVSGNQLVNTTSPTGLTKGQSHSIGTAATTDVSGGGFSFWSQLRNSVAGTAGFALRVATGVNHIFADFVGINTLLPTTNLDVNGNARVRGLAAGYVKSDASGNLTYDAVSHPKTLKTIYADVLNIGTTETDLDSYSVQPSDLAVNGNKIFGTYTMKIVVGNVSTQQTFKMYFGGTYIGGITASGYNTNDHVNFNFKIYRVSSSIIRYSITGSYNTVIISSFEGELSGINLTISNILKVTGQSTGTGAASGDIALRTCYLEFKP